jgi:hypothetical protein
MVMSIFRLVFNCWRCRWNLLRFGIASGLLFILAGDNASRLARVQFGSIPRMDYVAEVRSLRGQNRFAEALMVAETGLGELEGAERDALLQEQSEVREDQASVLRKGKELLRGALVGEGDSLEALIGAIAADMFVVGDVRDLLIQGGRLAVDGDSDELILALSAVGVLTTVMPEVDWVAAFLKVAKKAGALSKRMVESLVRIIRRATDTRDYTELRRLFGFFKDLVDRSTPAGALRVLRHLNDPKEVAVVAGFLKRQPAGGFVLHVAGKEGVEIVKTSVRESEEILVMAAKKGDRGMAWLRGGGQRLLRPHPIIGLLKGLEKGNVQQAITRVVADYDPYGWIAIPACAAWVFLEGTWLWRRLTAKRIVPPAEAALSQAA